jgi:hypothetical protein
MMKNTLRRLVLLVAAMLAFTVVGALPATAITGGEPDGNRHPNVGLLVFYDARDGLQYSCSATLVSPTVLVTAAHCTEGTVGVALVTFESVISQEPPSPVPDAEDPGIGYTPEELEADGYLWGTLIAHPEYSGFTDLSNWNDVGLVLLGEAVTGIAPATLAPMNYLDQFNQPVLNRTIFEIVGYGMEVRKPETGPQRPQPMTYPEIRRYTTAPGQKLTQQILQLQGNPNDTRGGGGICFGDSGGPVFLNGYLVAVSSYVYTLNCRYLSGYQRVDIPVVQNWLTPYL